MYYNEVNGIKMTQVNSSCINSVGFNEQEDELIVEFKQGTVYKYNCSKSLFEKLMSSKSKGQFMNNYFIGTNCTRIIPD